MVITTQLKDALDLINTLVDQAPDKLIFTVIKDLVKEGLEDSLEIKEELKAANNRIAALERSERHLSQFETHLDIIKDLASNNSSLYQINKLINKLDKTRIQELDLNLKDAILIMEQSLAKLRDYLVDLNYPYINSQLKEVMEFAYTNPVTIDYLLPDLEPIINKLAWNIALQTYIWEGNVSIL